MKKLCIVLAVLLSSNVNAEWGEQWGSMVWGQSSANVPMMGGVGQFIFFGLLLVIGVFVIKRWGLMKTLPAVAVLSLIPLIVEADEIQLNTFQNGEVADADEVNENFTNLKNAINAINKSNVITRQATTDYNEVISEPYCGPHGCYDYASVASLEVSVPCQEDELALSGGCNLDQVYSQEWGVNIISRNFIEENQQNCKAFVDKPEENLHTLTAYINCLSR